MGMEHDSCFQKQQQIVREFGHFNSSEELYHALINLGKTGSSLSSADKTPENRIHGCQSTAFCKTTFKNGKIYFEIEADALISAGLGQLIVRIYSGEPPEAVLQCSPDCFEKIGLSGALSPTRSNGLAQMLTHCKRAALACLVGSK